MGIIIRQGIKSTSAMYIGGMLGVLNRMFLMPKFLTLEQIGMIDLLFIAGLLFANIASLGTIGSLVKFYNRYIKQDKLPIFLGHLLTIAGIGIIITSCILYYFEPEIMRYYSKDSTLVKAYFPYFYVFLLALFLKGFFANFSLANQRATVPSVLFDFVFKAAQTILLLLLGYHFLEFGELIFAYSAVYYLLLIILIFYCKKQFSLKVKFALGSINKKGKKEVKNYSFFVWFAALSGTITQFIDTAMVGSYQGLAMAGVYSIAFNLGQSIEMPKRAISAISLPIIVKHLDNKEYKSVNKLYKQSSINQGIIGGLFLLLIFISIDSIFYLLPQSKNLEIGKNIALIIGLARFIDMVTGVNSEILRSSNKYKFDLFIVGSFIFISIWLNYILIPKYGIEGAAMASLIAILGFNAIRIYLLKHLYGFFPFSKESLKLLFILLLLVITRYALPQNPWPSQIGALAYITMLSSIYGSLFIFITYKWKLSQEWNNLLQKALQYLKR
jgi:O-antigen/teichoic acid export membrane protein